MPDDLVVMTGDGTPTALQLPGFTLTATALAPAGDVSLEQCREALRDLCRMERTVHWWIGDLLLHMKHSYGYEEESRELGFKPQTLEIDKHVSKQFEKLRRRNFLSWAHHREVAALTPPEQDAALDLAATEGWSCRQLRAHVRAGSREAARERAGPIPEGLYDVLLADPPWEYDFTETDSRQIEDNHYPAMTVEQLEALAVPSAPAAVLFLWATAPKLLSAHRVMWAWGFEYKTHAVWDKVTLGMGYWFRGRHELLLVGTRGGFSPPPESARAPSVLAEPRTGHSEKPEAFYRLVESMFPHATRLELFANRPRPGWTSWGAGHPSAGGSNAT